SIPVSKRAMTINLYGNLLHRMSRFTEAEAAGRRALALFANDERGSSYARVANDLGVTLEYQGRLEDALALYRDAAEAIGDEDRADNVKMNIGRLLLLLKRPA